MGHRNAQLVDVRDRVLFFFSYIWLICVSVFLTFPELQLLKNSPVILAGISKFRCFFPPLVEVKEMP